MRRFHLLVPALLIVAGLMVSNIFADTKAPASVIAVLVHGTVTVAHGQAAKPAAVKDNDALAAGDIVETALQSTVVLVLPNGSTVSLKERSRLAITLVLQSPYAAPDLVIYDHTQPESSTSSTSLDLSFGEVVAWVRKLLPSSDFSIKTPAGQSTVKGTEFEVAYAEGATGEASYRLSTAIGLVVFAPVAGKPVEAAANQQIEVRGRRDKTGLRFSPVQARPLMVEIRARIQIQNQTADQEVARTLQLARTRRDAARPDEPARNPDARPADQPGQIRPANPAAKRQAPPGPGKKRKPESPATRG